MGTGAAVATGDGITAAKMNLKLESVDTGEITDLAVTAAKLAQPTAQGVTGIGFRVCRATYSFAVDGGAVGTIALLGATSITPNAVICGWVINITAALTSAGAATAALQVEGADDLIAAALVSGAPWSSTGRKSVLPAFTGATSVRTTAARDVSLVIAVADLTAGAFDVYLFYIVVA